MNTVRMYIKVKWFNFRHDFGSKTLDFKAPNELSYVRKVHLSTTRRHTYPQHAAIRRRVFSGQKKHRIKKTKVFEKIIPFRHHLTQNSNFQGTFPYQEGSCIHKQKTFGILLTNYPSTQPFVAAFFDSTEANTVKISHVLSNGNSPRMQHYVALFPSSFDLSRRTSNATLEQYSVCCCFCYLHRVCVCLFT